jgi:hypothetical protein
VSAVHGPIGEAHGATEEEESRRSSKALIPICVWFSSLACDLDANSVSAADSRMCFPWEYSGTRSELLWSSTGAAVGRDSLSYFSRYPPRMLRRSVL